MGVLKTRTSKILAKSLTFPLIAALGVPSLPVSAADVTVLVWADPRFDGASGCNNESVNLQALVNATDGYTLDASITNMFDLTTTQLRTKLDTAGFFFVPDIESPAISTVIDSARQDVLRDWVNDGGVFVQTGTYGSKDADFLNQVFDFTAPGVTVGGGGPNWAKNDANAAGTPFASSPSTVPYVNATDAFNGTGVPGFKPIYGTTSDAVVATITYGRGTVIMLGWDFYSGGPVGCSFSNSVWVTNIFPASLNYAAQLSQSGLENPTTQGGTLKYTYSSNGTAYYVVQARATSAPADGAAIKTLVTSDPPGGLARGSAALTANTELSFSITGLTPATDYTVYAVTEYVNQSSQTVFSSIENVEFSTVPGVPTVSAVDPGNGQVSVSITPFGNETNFEYSTNDGSTWTARSTAATTSPWVISGLTNGQSYTFLFRSSYSNLTSAATSSFTVTPADLPSKPRSLAVTFGTTSGASLSWTAPSSAGGSPVTGYSVQYDTGSGWQSVSASGTTASVSGVWLDTNWSFRVAAVTNAGTGPYETYNHTAALPDEVTAPNGPTTLVTNTNKPDVTAQPGQPVAGTIAGGVVTPVASSLNRVTAQTPTDIRSETQTLLTNFNNRWGGAGTLTPKVTSVESNDGAIIYGLLSNTETDAPLGVPAQDVLMVTTATEAVMLAASSDNQPARVNPEGVLVVAQGSNIAVAVHGFPANTAGELVLLSDPTLLGTFTTDANGSFIGQTQLPPNLNPGNHSVVLITSSLVASLGVSLLANPSTGLVSRPYEGPLNLRHQSTTPCSGQEAILLGERLNTIAGVYVGDSSREFKLLSNGSLSYSLAGVAPGRHQVKVWVPISSVNLTSEIEVRSCAHGTSTTSRVNVGSFNGKLVVYAAGLEGKRISWKVGGKWGTQVATSSFARFDRPTPRRGVQVNVQIFIDGVPALTRTVLTR